MAKTSIYLPDDLADQARASGIPISEVAQAAVRRAVRDARLQEDVMTDIQAVAERLRATREADAEAEEAKAAAARACGVRWAREMATAAELESMVTYDGPPLEYRAPVSLIAVVASAHAHAHRAAGGIGLPGPSDLPTGPGDRYWPDLLAGAREVWEAVKPLLIEIDEQGGTVPLGSGGYSDVVSPEYRLWQSREPSPDDREEYDRWLDEQPDEFLFL